MEKAKDKTRPLILGKSGEELTSEEKSLYQKLNPVGFILYSRNLYTHLRKDQIQQESAIKLFIQSLKDLFPERSDVQIWIDEEGGAISNIERAGMSYEKDLLTSYDFYELFKETNDLEKTVQAVYDQFFAIGLKLKGLGFTGTFAPVADLFYENKSRQIGRRSFGPDVDLVIKFCRSALNALSDVGIESCMKHFPGHGLADADSHYFLPIIAENQEYLLQNDFRVFKELAPLTKYAMTAPLVYKCLDSENPITLSKKAIDFVRTNLNYEKVKIITDAIDMKALYLAQKMDVCEKNSVIKVKECCLEAGCDVVLYCHPNLEILQKMMKEV